MQQMLHSHTLLSQHTTFGIGGAARLWFEVTTAEDIACALQITHTQQLPFFILGGGSNILCHDDGYQGAILHLTPPNTSSLKNISKDIFEVHAGTQLNEVVQKSAQNGHSGIEELAGIPGSVGGAIRGNAGAFGTTIGDTLVSVTAYNTQTSNTKIFSVATCDFQYRTSFFKTHTDWVILTAQFATTPEAPESCIARVEAIHAKRETRQPQHVKSAGSFFVNPQVSKALRTQFEQEKNTISHGGRVPAGWLIEKIGYKNKEEQGVCTGTESANYVINTSHATAHAVHAFTKKIHDTVLDAYDVDLIPEVTFLGFDDVI